VERAYFLSIDKNPEEEKLTPAEKKIPFKVPLLAIKQGDIFEAFEETHFLDHHWELRKCVALLSEKGYPSARPDAEYGASSWAILLVANLYRQILSRFCLQTERRSGVGSRV
jgi:hypothetical protein